MKLILLCVALVAGALAMPVAEDKDVTSVPAPAPLPKPEDKKQDTAQSIAIPEKPVEDKPLQEKEKSSDNQSKNVDKSSEEIGNKDVSQEKQNAAIPAVKSVPVDNKSEIGQTTQIKSEEKPEVKPEEKKDESKVEDAQVKEVVKEPVPSAKSTMVEESIDVVSAVKNPAAVADDVVDPVAIISQPQKKIDLPVVAGKDAQSSTTEQVKNEKKEEVKPEKPSENKPAAEQKPAEPKAVVSAETTVPSDDSLRVVRDTVDDKAKEVTPEGKSNDVKSVEPVAEVQKQTETKSEEVPKPVEPEKAESPVKSAEPVKPEAAAVSGETPKPDEAGKPQEAQAKSDVKPEEKVETKPETKPEEKAAANDAKDSSESNESGEKKDDKGDSSEESSEQTDNKDSGAPKS